MAVATSTAILIGAGVALAGTGAAVYQGEQAKAQQKRGLRLQADAQRQSEIAALRTQRQNEEAIARANMRQPDLLGILSAEQRAAQGAAGATTLTGPKGLDPSGLNLGRLTPLGL